MKYELRVVRRGSAPDLRFLVFATNDAMVLERMTLWACAQSGRGEWQQLILERDDDRPPGFMRLTIDGPFDAELPPDFKIGDIRIG